MHARSSFEIDSFDPFYSHSSFILDNNVGDSVGLEDFGLDSDDEWPKQSSHFSPRFYALDEVKRQLSFQDDDAPLGSLDPLYTHIAPVDQAGQTAVQGWYHSSPVVGISTTGCRWTQEHSWLRGSYQSVSAASTRGSGRSF